MFGRSIGGLGGGLGQAEDDDAVVEPGPGGPQGGGATAAGGPTAPTLLPPQMVVQELDVALQHARTAQHRLLDVPLGTIPQEQVTSLTATFNTIQANVADVVQRAMQVGQNQQLLESVNRDAQEVVEQVQQYVEAVEGTLTERGVQPQNGGARQLAPRQPIDPANLALMGAAAVGVGIVGVAIWQINKRKKAQAREERAEARRKRRR